MNECQIHFLAIRTAKNWDFKVNQSSLSAITFYIKKRPSCSERITSDMVEIERAIEDHLSSKVWTREGPELKHYWRNVNVQLRETGILGKTKSEIKMVSKNLVILNVKIVSCFLQLEDQHYFDMWLKMKSLSLQ